MGYTIVVHTAGNPSALMEPVRRQIHLLDPYMAVYNSETMEEHVRTAYFLPHLAAMLFGTFGFIGLVLAIVGLYGVMSYAVSSRTWEIGIRMAKGARPGTVERLDPASRHDPHFHCRRTRMAGGVDVLQTGRELSVRHSTARRSDLCSCAATSFYDRDDCVLDPSPPCGFY